MAQVEILGRRGMEGCTRDWVPGEETWQNGRVRIALGEGIASVPDCANIEYMGFVVLMTPRAFLSLAARRGEREDRSAWLRGQIEAGRTIGAPFLSVELDDKWDPVIKGHEGRNRMAAIADVLGQDAAVPVCILPRGGMRARHVTDAMVERLRDGAVPEREAGVTVQRPAVGGPLFGTAWLQDRELEPGQAALGPAA